MTRNFRDVPYATARVGFAVLAFLAWLGWGMACLPPTADWFGNLYTFLHHDLWSSEILGSAHYNRFPLNTLYLYGTFTTLSDQVWAARLLMWAWVLGFLWVWGTVLRNLSGDGAYALLAAGILLGHQSFFQTLIDLSCTHYLGAMLLVTLALRGVLNEAPLWRTILISCLGTLFSEVALLCVPTLIALRAGRERRFLARQDLWFGLIGLFYVALRGAAYSLGGTTAARWNAYSVDLTMVPQNLFETAKFVVVPQHGEGGGSWGSVYFWIGSALVLAVVVATLPLLRRASVAQEHRFVHRAWLPVALGAPLILVVLVPQFPRLYLTFVFIALTWLAWGWTRVPRRWATPVLGLWLLVSTLGFSYRFSEYVSAGSYWGWFRQELAQVLEREPETKSWVVYFDQSPNLGLDADWGLPLALHDSKLRATILGGENPVEISVAFPSTRGICSDKPPPERSIALLRGDARRTLWALPWCDSKCGACQELSWQETRRAH